MSIQGPLVSVLTPVYNGEPYLRECIESVLAQTYNHWDYTIINNCSTDRTLEIAREYAEKDPRIRIHNNETFVRVIQNHNIAFRQISPASKYCKVVAADDWLFAECLEKMICLAEKHPNVTIVGSYGLKGSNIIGLGLPLASDVVKGKDACRSRLLGGAYVFGNATSVLFRSDIVRSRHAFYNEANLHADAEVCFEFLEHSDFGFVHQVLCFMRDQETSLTAFSRNFQTYWPEWVYNLMRYGPKYLSSDELSSRLGEVFKNYYAYLGKQVYKRRGRDFWDFHKGKLRSLGHPLKKSRLAAVAIGHALDIILNPKMGTERIARRLWQTLK